MGTGTGAVEILLLNSETSRGLSFFDDRLRILLPVIIALSGLICERWSSLLILFICALAAMLIASKANSALVKRIFFAETMILLLVLSLPFTWPGQDDIEILSIGINLNGVEEAGRILLRSNISMLALIGFTFGMTSSQMGDALQRLGVSRRLTSLLMLTIRYLSLLQHEFLVLQQQLKLRGFTPGFNWHSWKTYGYLIGTLLLRSLDRAERVGQAMRCRGFNGRFPSPEKVNLNTQQFFILFFCLMFSGALCSLEWWL